MMRRSAEPMCKVAMLRLPVPVGSGSKEITLGRRALFMMNCPPTAVMMSVRPGCECRWGREVAKCTEEPGPRRSRHWRRYRWR
jgi:hypothetical protein